jgi:hypothetical protein
MSRAKRSRIASGLTGLLDSAVLLLALQMPSALVADGMARMATVECPHCGQSVPYPSRARDGSLTLAECDDCDIYFDVESVERRKRRAPIS